MKKEDIKELEDLGKPEVTIEDGRQKITGITLKTSGRIRQGVITSMSAPKPKFKKSKELPTHIRKATITINDKDKGNPIKIAFEGDWVPSDINLAGKFLILDFHSYVRNRAMKGK